MRGGEAGGRTRKFRALIRSVVQGVVVDMWRKEKGNLSLESLEEEGFSLMDTRAEEDFSTLLRRQETREDILILLTCLEEGGTPRERLIARALSDLLTRGVDLQGSRELYDLVYEWCLRHCPEEGWTREGMREYFYRLRKRLRSSPESP